MKVPTILQELVFRSKFVQSRNSLVKIVVSVSNVATFAVVVIAQMIVRVALVWQMLTWLAGISLLQPEALALVIQAISLLMVDVTS
jgi:hypothetical protein